MLLSVIPIVVKASFLLLSHIQLIGIHRGTEMDMFKYVNSLPHQSFLNSQERGCFSMIL
jgi:hypothetical protein